MKFKLQRRDIILILGFWLIGCALLGIVGYFILYPDITAPTTIPQAQATQAVIVPQATVTVTHFEFTAKGAQPLTQEKLSQWEKDAHLIAVVSTWEKTSLDSVGQATAWTYRYYSPSQKRLFFITVSPDGSVMGTSHGERIYNAPYSIPAEMWSIDSPQALNIWLNYGGEAMLSALKDIQVVAQLEVPNPDAPLQWVVAGYDPDSQNYHTVFINAQSAKVEKIVSSLKQQ